MKLRNKILAMAVVAVAGVNVYNANTLNKCFSDLQLDNIEMLAYGEIDAEDCGYSAIDYDKNSISGNTEFVYCGQIDGKTCPVVKGKNVTKWGFCKYVSSNGDER